MRQFSHQQLLNLDLTRNDKVLEIGPNRRFGALNSKIFELMPETFFDLRTRIDRDGFQYWDLDSDPAVGSDFIGDLGSSTLLLPKEFFNVVVAFSVLEHTGNLIQAISNIRSSMVVGGVLHIITPWDLRFHGPRPDMWRISDDGYEFLLRDHFRLDAVLKLTNVFRQLSPVGIYVKAVRTL